MKASKDAYELIKHFESLRLRSYLDMTGKWTIGWGHTGDDVGKGMIIGLADAQRFLIDDVEYVEHALSRMILRDIKQHEFDALVSLAFNIGTGRFKGSTLLKFLNFGEIIKAGEEFLKWRMTTLPNGKKVLARGLVTRRAAERHLFLTGKMDISGPERA